MTPPPGATLEGLRERARGRRARILLAEGDEPRVVAAAERAAALGVCLPTLLTTPAAAAGAAAAAGVPLTVPVREPRPTPADQEAL
jgi:phosphotransacetylase